MSAGHAGATRDGSDDPGRESVRRRQAAGRAPMLVVGLATLLLLLLSALAVLLAYQTYWQTLEAAEAKARSASQVVAAHTQWLIEAADQALRRIDGALYRPADDEAGDQLDEAVAGLPSEVTAWIFDIDGHSVRSNLPGSGAVDIGDRADFKALRDGAEWRIGPLMKGFGGDRPVFLVSRRIARNGRFLGVVAVTIPVDLLSQFWQSLDLGPHSSVGLLRSDGWLVARYPVPADTIDLSHGLLFTTYLPNGPAGSYTSPRSPADGVARIVGFYSVPGLPLIATAGISRDAALDHFRSQAIFGLLLALPVIALLVGATVWIYRLLLRDRRNSRALEATLEENSMLLREIHHRVKNNLQTVASLIQLQPGPPEPKEAMVRRLTAMTALHEQIYGRDQFARVDLKDYLSALARKLADSFGDNVTIETALAPLEVEAAIATPLGLIVNEVVANAVKHAFPAGQPGTVRLGLLRLPDGRARLQVADDGVGFRTAASDEGERAPPRSGMGSRLIRGLAHQIQGEHRFRPAETGTGTVFELDFPADPEQVAA